MDKKKAYMSTAYIFAKLSKAKRLQVGSVLVKDGRVITCGYNGTIQGSDNNCETEDGKATLPTVIHSEANSILFAAKNGTSTKGCAIYTTHSPCFECCKMIAQAGIKEVYFRTKFRDTEGLDFLKINGIKVEQI